MLAGHRWERDFDWLGYRCMPLPFGGVESHQWCVGCGCRIGDLELHNSRLPVDNTCSLHISLDILVDRKGFKPIEAGTLAEFHLKNANLQSRSKSKIGGINAREYCINK